MKTKQLLFAIALFSSVAFMKAQDKYEFAIIEYHCNGGALSVSIDGTTFTTEEVEIPKEERDKSNAKPFLKKVKELQDQSWEVMSFNIGYSGLNGYINNPIHFAYLRKKIK